MTYKEKADQLGITVAELRAEQMAFLQSEGYDENGREYETLDKWIERHKRPRRSSYEPVDGGRGFGTYGEEE